MQAPALSPYLGESAKLHKTLLALVCPVLLATPTVVHTKTTLSRELMEDPAMSSSLGGSAKLQETSLVYTVPSSAGGCLAHGAATKGKFATSTSGSLVSEPRLPSHKQLERISETGRRRWIWRKCPC